MNQTRNFKTKEIDKCNLMAINRSILCSFTYIQAHTIVITMKYNFDDTLKIKLKTNYILHEKEADKTHQRRRSKTKKKICRKRSKPDFACTYIRKAHLNTIYTAQKIYISHPLNPQQHGANFMAQSKSTASYQVYLSQSKSHNTSSIRSRNIKYSTFLCIQ